MDGRTALMVFRRLLHLWLCKLKEGGASHSLQPIHNSNVPCNCAEKMREPGGLWWSHRAARVLCEMGGLRGRRRALFGFQKSPIPLKC